MKLKCINADIVAGIILLIISAISYNMASGFDNPDAEKRRIMLAAELVVRESTTR